MLASQKRTKKRPALYQAGPRAKKPHFETSTEKIGPDGDQNFPKQQQSRSGRERVHKPDAKENMHKRRRPVTKTTEDSEEESDQGEDEEEADDVEDGDNMIVDQKIIGSTSHESHKAQKALLFQRRSQKPHAYVLSQAKQIWSLLRQKSLPSAERQAYLQTLTSLLLPDISGDESHNKTKGTNPSNIKLNNGIKQDSIKLKDLIFNHSFSRIIQTIFKYSSQSKREYIAQQLEGSYELLSENRYSRFLVCKIMKVASPERRRKIMGEYERIVVGMVNHKEAGKVVADAFELYAGEWERAVLVRGFYGKEVTLFESGFKAGSDEEKTKIKRGLKGLLEGLDIEKRKRILTSTKENLMTIFNNPSKGGVTHAIVHRALWEYLSAIHDAALVPSEVEEEKLHREMFECCQEVLAEIVHTRDGSRTVRDFLARGTAKDRKQILKVLKPHIEKICLDDEAQTVLFTALDVIDDTKLLSKMLVDPIVSSADTLYNHTQGRRTLLYLLVPRSRRHFMPAQIACLEETDVIRERTSKKSKEARQGEVRSAASGELVRWVEREGGVVVREAGGCLTLAEVMLYAEGEKKRAIQTLLHALKPSQTETETKSNLIDFPPASRLYKVLLQGGHFNRSTQRVERVSSASWDTSAFATMFMNEVGRDTTIAMCLGTGNGAFVVAELVEALNRGLGEGGIQEGRERVGVEEARKTVKAWFEKEVVEEVERGEAKGRKVLLEKLSLLSSSLGVL